ncbi:MAG: carboxypeptidase regulatory-like domain-containing protein [Anaerolineae bacterium]|nr:carboxypeptidase regulatory-like domain-containing protein [Anaerolineae bacterium]
MRALLLAVALAVIGALAIVSTPVTSAPHIYQLLTNPGVESYNPPYGDYQGVDLQVASGWQRFWCGGAEPYWMDTRVFAHSDLGCGWVERIEGETSQMIFATEPYTAGIQQQVTGLTPGVGYGFHAALLTIFQTGKTPADGAMIKRVGMDPTGGSDPQAPTVVWSEADGRDRNWSIDLRTSVLAQVPTMTVFIRVDSLYASGDPGLRNQSFLDSAILALTPVITATSPAVSDIPTFTVSWDNAVPAPGCIQLKWREVQWLDEAEGVWHDWIARTYLVQADFVGERGHTYRFRARVWQHYENGAHLHGPYRAEGDTRTEVRWPVVSGRVLGPDGLPASGATVAATGAAHTATSGLDGHFELNMPVSPDPHTVTVSHPFWLAPSPLYSVTLGLTETLPFTWTLRPPDDAVTNGEFEAGVEGWHSVGITPTVVNGPVHTGHGALALSGAAGVTLTAGVTQGVAITDSWEPVLSFWYNPTETAAGDRFNVFVTVVAQTISATLPVTLTHILTPALDTPGWTHLAYRLSPLDVALSATVTIDLRLWHAAGSNPVTSTLYLDEVSLGRTMGGPHKAYLPLVWKRR